MAGPGHDTTSRLTVAVAAFLESCRSPNTRAAYRADLDHFVTWCRVGGTVDLGRVTVEDVAAYRAECEAQGAAPATVARRLSAIASFGAYERSRGAGDMLPTSRNIERPAASPESSAELLTDDEADALLEASDGLGARAAALIRLLMLDGLKVGDIVRADASAVEGRAPKLRLALSAHRPRVLSLHPDTAVALSRYLGRRRSGPLLLSDRRGRPPERLTRFGIDFIVKQTATAARLEPPISGNTLRRHYVMQAHARGTALDDIRAHAGHADSRTTRRYLRRR